MAIDPTDPLIISLRHALSLIADGGKKRWAICVVFDIEGDDLNFLYANTRPDLIPGLLRAAAEMHHDGEPVAFTPPTVN